MPQKQLFLLLGVILVLVCGETRAIPKPHVITFGKWTATQWRGPDGQGPFDLKIRPLIIDSRVKEYTVGLPHELTDRLFVVRRAFRVNDALPGETTARWQWQRGGWLLVDRLTARIVQLNLPEFDAFYSSASWYRDYIAYCGVSEDGKKLYAMVLQVGRRKPILKREISEPAADAEPDSECPAPTWERSPARVTFHPAARQKLVFLIRGRVLDVLDDSEDEGEP